jgi:hypothetical protein
MAKLVAFDRFDLFSVDLSWYFFNVFDSGLEKTVFVNVNGRAYPDLFWVNGYDGFDDLELDFLGSNLTQDSIGRITGGTVNFIAEGDFNSGQLFWYAEDIAVSASALYDAATTTSNADELGLISSALSGDDQILLSPFADRMNGFAGNDLITGGLGQDWLAGGAGNDTFSDTKAGLSGDVLADFTFGDRIIISDAILSNFSFTVAGSTLTYSGGSLSFGSALNGILVASAVSGGGVQLALQVPPSVNGNADGDFNGDGRSDVLLQSSTGAVTVWRGQANGSLIEATGLGANALDASWIVAGLGDFNGDGRDDILWRHTSGTIGEWLGQTGQFTNNSGVAANAVDNSWAVAGIADYNGDGRDDILWRHSSGEIGQWLAQPNGSFANNGGAAANLVDPSWTVMASGDFNGDGRADILWRHTSGVYAEWQGSATGKLNNVGGVMTGATGSVIGSGDFNGDGRDDLLMRNESSGALTNWLGQANGQFTVFTPTQQLSDLNWKIVAIGDYNGDGRDDLIWKHSSGATGEWLGSTSGDFAHNGAAPIVASNWTVQSPDLFLV